MTYCHHSLLSYLIYLPSTDSWLSGIRQTYRSIHARTESIQIDRSIHVQWQSKHVHVDAKQTELSIRSVIKKTIRKIVNRPVLIFLSSRINQQANNQNCSRGNSTYWCKWNSDEVRERTKRRVGCCDIMHSHVTRWKKKVLFKYYMSVVNKHFCGCYCYFRFCIIVVGSTSSESESISLGSRPWCVYILYSRGI